MVVSTKIQPTFWPKSMKKRVEKKRSSKGKRCESRVKKLGKKTINWAVKSRFTVEPETDGRLGGQYKVIQRYA